MSKLIYRDKVYRRAVRKHLLGVVIFRSLENTAIKRARGKSTKTVPSSSGLFRNIWRPSALGRDETRGKVGERGKNKDWERGAIEVGDEDYRTTFGDGQGVSVQEIDALRLWLQPPTLISNLSELLKDYFLSFFRTARSHFFVSLLFLALMGSIFYGTNYIYQEIFKDLPNPSLLAEKPPPVSTKIVDRNNQVLYRLYEHENRTIIPYEDIPPQAIYSIIAIEDKNFFNHHGVSPSGIIRALKANIKGERLEGGSTITQQLVKNRLLNSQRTWTRKIKEIILAIETERLYSKEEILEMYLNQVAFGGSTYGIEEAAQSYFQKSAKNLSLPEAALLAGLPQAPSTYSPFGAYPERAFLRQEEVLRRLTEDGYITKEQAIAAMNQPLVFRKDAVNIVAPHFVMYVREILESQYDEELLNNGGLTIRTTLDNKLQEASQLIVSDEVEKLGALRVGNGAALITNPKTGEILSMVGSTNYFDYDHSGQVNLTIRLRQPGSSIKPLTYALAFSNGFSPSSTIEDSPITFRFENAKPYSPVNYDGKFHGRVTLREALASSYNVPAVKLLNILGVNNLIDLGEKMGITTWGERQRFGLSLTLGGGEIKMTEMATMYGVFANNGTRVDLNPILEITDYTGKVLYRNECALDGVGCPIETVISPGVAYMITHVLSDNRARTPAFGPMSTLYIPNQQVAVKTGTTNNLRDNWTIGYTSDRVVAVWVGNNDNQPMSYVASGITGASPIWNSLMRTQLSNDSPHAFIVPTEAKVASICTYTGRAACAWCQSTKEEVFLEGKVPMSNCRSGSEVPQILPVMPLGNQ